MKTDLRQAGNSRFLGVNHPCLCGGCGVCGVLKIAKKKSEDLQEKIEQHQLILFYFPPTWSCATLKHLQHASPKGLQSNLV